MRPDPPEHIVTRQQYRDWLTEQAGTTQAAHPWRATLRTAVALVIPLAALLPSITQTAGVDESLPLVAGALAGAGAITRVLALPRVETLLRSHPWTSWLAAGSPGSSQDRAT